MENKYSELYLKSFEELIGVEIGYADIKADKGKETYDGIRRDLWGHVTPEIWKVIDKMRKLGKVQHGSHFPELNRFVSEFYHKYFWKSNCLDDLPAEIAPELFDIAVNHGSGFAGETIQRAVNMLNNSQKRWKDIIVDGIIGNYTVAAVKASSNYEREMFVIIKIIKGNHYVTLLEKDKTQELFAIGWIRRVRFYETKKRKKK